MSSTAKSSLVITVFTGLGLILSFFTNTVIANKFGAGKEMDVYFVATTLPNFLTTILLGTLSATFIPVLNEYRNKGESEAAKIISSLLNILIVFGSVLCLLGIIFSPALIRIMTPGFPPESVAAATPLLRWLLPVVVFTLANELLSGIYFSHQNFVVPMMIRIISPLLTLLYVFLFSASLSTRSLVLATLSSGILQTGILAFGLVSNKYLDYDFSFSYRHPGFLKVLRLMVPLILGMLVTKIVPLFDRWIASSLPAGSISLLGYSTKLIGVIQPMITTGISVTFLTLMSQLAAKKDFEELQSTMTKGLRMLLFMSIPLTAILGIYGMPVVRLVFERGAFSHQDTILTFKLFAIYLLAVPSTCVGTILGQGYYVIQDTVTPVVVGILEIALYIVLALVLLPAFGVYAIPISYAVYFLVSIFANGAVLSRKMRFPILALMAGSLWHQAVSAVGGVLIVAGCNRLPLHNRLMPFLGLGAGFAGYFLLEYFLFRSLESRAVAKMMLSKLGLSKRAAPAEYA